MPGLRAAAVIGLIAFGVAAHSAEPAPITSQWTVTLGVEAGVLPTYEGSDRYMLRPFPLFDVRRAGTPPTFHAPRDGFGFGLYDNGPLRIGPTVKIRFPRRESDDPDLRGLGTDWALEVGGFADYWVTPWLRVRAELR